MSNGFDAYSQYNEYENRDGGHEEAGDVDIYTIHIIDVICAWCEAEGRRTLIRTVPSDKPGASHGICHECMQLVLGELGL